LCTFRQSNPKFFLEGFVSQQGYVKFVGTFAVTML